MAQLVLLGVAPLVLLTASACYTDKINKAPVARIFDPDPSADVLIGEPMRMLSAKLSTDADHEVMTYAWNLHCIDDEDPQDPCFIKSSSSTEVQLELAPGKLAHKPVVVTLRVTDPRGATSETSLTFHAKNRLPAIEVAESADNHKNRNGKYTVGRELTLVVRKAEDPDGDIPLQVTWSISKHPDGAHPETSAATGNSFQIRPDKASDDEWTARATVDDGFGGTPWAEVNFKVEDDLPPCLEGLDPEIPAGFAVVVHRAGGPRTFTVGTVSDDLDSYPLATNPDDRSGVAAFRWSLVLPGPTPAPPDPAVPQVVGGQVTNIFKFDPATYAPGDHVAVRVDVTDHSGRSCPVEQPTCAAPAPADACLSRYTWNVEVR